MSIKPIVLKVRRGGQLINRYNKTSTNIATILINAIYKEFY